MKEVLAEQNARVPQKTEEQRTVNLLGKKSKKKYEDQMMKNL